ncbi:SURF1 family protein [Mesorhizobium sp. SB112]|uniref:SURF1 family protein n=1 Tax=Mesorhizobium sp. SB112 TaxID=3151853 RepID=UPI0032660452
MMAGPEPYRDEQEPRVRSARATVLVTVSGFAMTCLLLALGLWQIERLEWKLGLIQRVDTRLQSGPVAPPVGEAWDLGLAPDHEYRPIRVVGTFVHAAETLVQAVTDHGSGYWVMTPLVDKAGRSFLINRGFVPRDRANVTSRSLGQLEGEIDLTGLLRLSEPDGGFMRTNDPNHDRWYSRDVAAISKARGLREPAPYFIDADAAANPGGYPVGGLTVLSFRNPHLGYALTWFALAAMVACATLYAVKDDIRRRRIVRTQRLPNKKHALIQGGRYDRS